MQRIHLISSLGLLFILVACGSEGATEAQPAEVSADAVGTQAIDDFIAQQNIDKSIATWKTQLPKPPEVAFDDKTYFWDVETNVGKIVITT